MLVKSGINMQVGIGGIINKLGIEKRKNVKHAFKFMTPMVWLTRLLVGAYPQWIGCKPEKIQRIYFANHSSHLDTIVIWSALPRALRPLTRPVAARDYWQSGIRRRIAVDELNVVLVDRRRTENSDPLDPMRQALREGSSLIIFPEGTRYKGEEGGAGEFKAGAFRIAVKTSAPVVPVAVTGARALFESNGNRCRPGSVRIKIMPPIQTAGMSKAEQKQLPDAVRQSILAALK